MAVDSPEHPMSLSENDSSIEVQSLSSPQDLSQLLEKQDALLNLLREDRARVSELPEKGVLLLEAIHRRLESEATKTQFFWNAFLQLVGLAFAAVFGAFAVLAWNTGKQANNQSNDANLLALVSLCLTTNMTTTPGACATILENSGQVVNTLAVAVTGLLPTNSSSTPPSSSLLEVLSRGQKVGIVIGAAVLGLLTLIALIYFNMQIYYERFANKSSASVNRLRRDRNP